MATSLVNQEDKYVVAIPTPKGPAIIESVAKWEEALFVGAYIAISRRNRIKGTNRVPVSAFFTNSPEDAR